MKIVAVIPAYNEEKNIDGIVRQTKKEVDETIVVNDGSKDNTAILAKMAGAFVINHNINKGYGIALKSGFNHALKINADIVVLLDADAQHNPKEIQRVVEPIMQKMADMVIGSRFLSDIKMPFYRKFGIKIITMFTMLLTGHKITDAQSGFRGFSREVLRSIDLEESGMGVSVETIFKVVKGGFKILEVPITCQYEKIVHRINPLSHGLQIVLSILTYFIKTL